LEEEEKVKILLFAAHSMSTVAPTPGNSNVRPAIARSQSYALNGIPAPPIAAPQLCASETKNAPDAVLELIDGTAFRGISFGAQEKGVAGECVFQTGARMAPHPSHIYYLLPSSKCELFK
jgi:hypothetical protein